MTTPPSEPNSFKIGLTKILDIYKQAIKNLPLLRYSWILIATICILALTAYFKLNNSNVFFYAFGVIVICLFGFLVSNLLKTNEVFIKLLVYFLLTCIALTTATAVLGFGCFIISGKPDFYVILFPNQSNTQKPKIIPKIDSSQYKYTATKKTVVAQSNKNVIQNHISIKPPVQSPSKLKILTEAKLHYLELDYRLSQISANLNSQDTAIQRNKWLYTLFAWRCLTGDNAYQPLIPEFKNIPATTLLIWFSINTNFVSPNYSDALSALESMDQQRDGSSSNLYKTESLRTSIKIVRRCLNDIKTHV